MPDLCRCFLKSQNGATAIEYGLIASILALALLPALSPITGSLEGTFSTLHDAILAGSGGGSQSGAGSPGGAAGSPGGAGDPGGAGGAPGGAAGGPAGF